MTNRVLFGERNNNYGLWISKPGFDVLQPLTSDQLLFDTSIKLGQIVQAGTVALPTSFAPVEIDIVDLGFRPMVRTWVAGYAYVAMTYLSNTRIRFSVSPGSPGIYTQQIVRIEEYASPYILYQVWALESL